MVFSVLFVVSNSNVNSLENVMLTNIAIFYSSVLCYCSRASTANRKFFEELACTHVTHIAQIRFSSKSMADNLFLLVAHTISHTFSECSKVSELFQCTSFSCSSSIELIFIVICVAHA